MANARILLLLVLLVATVCQGHYESNDCSLSPPAFTSAKCPDTSDFKFCITSRRNRTGHWIAQAQLEHDGGQDRPRWDETEAGLWHVDLEKRTPKCGSDYSIQFVATITVLPPRAPPGCSTPGYELFPGVGYYKLHKYGKTWDQARKICKEEGGNLVIINSEEESKVLQHLFALAPNIHGVNHNDFAFIGFHDRFVEGEYLTIFGKPLGSTGYTMWPPGQPDNSGGNENCGSLGRNGHMNDITCSWKLAFFCEKGNW